MTTWWPAFVTAVRRNYMQRDGVSEPLDAVEAWWRDQMTYRYDGPAHAIRDVIGCCQRGYGACADAAADLMAHALLRHRHGLGELPLLCVETSPRLAGYSHVRVVVGERAYDPYASKRPTVPPSCSQMLVVDVQ